MNEIIDAIDRVNWTELKTAYGKATEVAENLKALVSKNEKVQLEASHELWCGLCHQHAYVSSAAEPAFPILLQIFPNVSDLVQIEIMDIFMGFAVCTTPGYPEAGGEFQKRLRAQLLAQFDFFENLCKHSNEVIASFSEGILESLKTKLNENAARDATHP
jgi:hypothetical protein